MKEYTYINLRQRPSLKDEAAVWFHKKWQVPEEAYRCQGIAGHLLNMAEEELRTKGITPVYLITDHTSFYERYGWEFLCMVQGEDEPELMRMYIHR